MSEISTHPPTGSVYHQASAWLLVVACILLGLTLLFRLTPIKDKLYLSLGKFFGVQGETSKLHTWLYVLLFVLVFVAMLSFFIN